MWHRFSCCWCGPDAAVQKYYCSNRFIKISAPACAGDAPTPSARSTRIPWMMPDHWPSIRAAPCVPVRPRADRCSCRSRKISGGGLSGWMGRDESRNHQAKPVAAAFLDPGEAGATLPFSTRCRQSGQIAPWPMGPPACVHAGAQERAQIFLPGRDANIFLPAGGRRFRRRGARPDWWPGSRRTSPSWVRSTE